ncbi:MAG: hypothetical protein AAB223_01820, partial [Pseudomonadota bacterium]
MSGRSSFGGAIGAGIGSGGGAGGGGGIIGDGIIGAAIGGGGAGLDGGGGAARGMRRRAGESPRASNNAPLPGRGLGARSAT